MKSKVDYLKEISARVHGCHEAAIVKVSGGLDRFHLRMGHQKDCRDLYLDDNLLAFGNVDGCATCETFLYRGYGEGAMNLSECRAIGDSLNGPYKGLEASTHNLAPILGLFSSGYYVLADCDQYPTAWGESGFADFILGGSDPYETGIRFYGGCQMKDLHTAPLFLWASQSPLWMDWDRVRYYMDVFKTGREDLPRPVAVFMNGGTSLVLDGHHKIAAAAMIGRTLRANLIFKLTNLKHVEQALQRGDKMFLCAPGTRAQFVEDCKTRSQRLEYDISYGPAFLCDSHEKVLSNVECWEGAVPLPKAEPMHKRFGAWEVDGRIENEFLSNYKPAKISFPLITEINHGTHVYLNYVRRSLANLRKAYDQLHGLPQDGLQMAKDLIAYKKLFPDGKWVSESELNWLKRICEKEEWI